MIHFEQEITALKDKLLTMASKATDAVNKSIKALVDRDDELAREVQHEDDELDRLEIEIDEIAIGLLVDASILDQGASTERRGGFDDAMLLEQRVDGQRFFRDNSRHRRLDPKQYPARPTKYGSSQLSVGAAPELTA